MLTRCCPSYVSTATLPATPYRRDYDIFTVICTYLTLHLTLQIGARGRHSGCRQECRMRKASGRERRRCCFDARCR